MSELFYDFIYLNEERIESWFAQLNGEVEREHKVTTTNGRKVTGKLGIEIGNLLAKLGLAKGTADGEGEANYSKVIETTRSLSLDNKLIVLKEYLQNHKEIGKIYLLGAVQDGLLQDIKRSKYQIITGNFNVINYGEGVILFQSKLENSKGEPLVKIPVLEKYLRINNTRLFMVLREIYLPGKVGVSNENNLKISALCQCETENMIVTAPAIAIWLGYGT